MNDSSTLSDFVIRRANPDDCELILRFIRELASYEKLAHEVTATAATLAETLFGASPAAEVLIGDYRGEPVACAVFFQNFSTFHGRPGIYLEDLYVKPQWRGRGFGQSLLRHIARLAVARHCTRLEWSVLDWNAAAIDFYRSTGAIAMNEWTVQRLHGDALHEFAAEGEHP